MKNIILVVDDDKTNLALAQKILLPQYRIAASNEAAEKVDTTAYIWYNVIIKYRRWHYG